MGSERRQDTPELEVTQEMVEAGVAELWRHIGPVGLPYDTIADDVVKDVFRRMILLRRRDLP